MVEFALVLPVLLLLLFGIIEVGRLFVVFISVYNASREAARYGSAAGDNASGIPFYQDCDGIRDTALRVGFLAGIDPANIDVRYDHGPNGEIPWGSLPTCPGDVELGDRIAVQVSGEYQPLLPLVNFPPIPLTATGYRTIIKEVEILGTPPPSPTYKYTRTPTLTKTPTPTDTPIPPTNTPTVPTDTPTNTPTTPTSTPTDTPTVTTTPSAVYCTGAGSITRQWWLNLSGGGTVSDYVSALTSNPRYPDSPDGTANTTTFEGPNNFAEDYGTRIYGYLCPPYTGTYTFWIATDDPGEFWLSTDSDPAHATKIAYLDQGWASPRQWDKYSTQQSASVVLQAGQLYFIQALQKEGDNLDNVAVGWTGPYLSPSVTVINGIYLVPMTP